MSFSTPSKPANARVHFPEVSQSMVLRSCKIDTVLTHDAKCYWYYTGGGIGRGFELPVVVLKSTAAQPSQEPLAFISGGPGQLGNTLETSVSYWDDWLNRAKIERDFVLFDLRGSQQGEGGLHCEPYMTLSHSLMAEDLSFEQEYQRLNPVLTQCLQSLSAGHDTGLFEFTSLQNAEDLSRILSGLKYEAWHLMGVSYGTRVAIVAALTQPNVKSIILDSPYPLNRGKLSDLPTLWHDAFQQFLGPKSTVLHKKFTQVRGILERKPLNVTVENWTTGKDVTWVLNGQRFAAVVYSALYSSESYGPISALINELASGSQPTDLSELEVFYNQIFDPSFNTVLYFATECNDNPLVTEAEYNQSLQKVGKMRELFENDWHQNICRSSVFKTGQNPDMQHLTLPALIAVGSLDPVTTPEHASELMASFSHVTLIQLPKRAHAEFYSSDCGVELITQFLSGELKGIESPGCSRF